MSRGRASGIASINDSSPLGDPWREGVTCVEKTERGRGARHRDNAGKDVTPYDGYLQVGREITKRRDLSGGDLASVSVLAYRYRG